jgi:hypothetical protein
MVPHGNFLFQNKYRRNRQWWCTETVTTHFFQGQIIHTKILKRFWPRFCLLIKNKKYLLEANKYISYT